MKRVSNNKSKNAQGFNAKGCLKISSFFPTQSQIKKPSALEPKETSLAHKQINQVIVIESDEDDVVQGPNIKSPKIKKRKLDVTAPDNSLNQLAKKANNRVLQPSASGSILPQIKLKNVEKLLTREALKEYQSPEKVMERFVGRTGSTTPQKLVDRGASSPNVTPRKDVKNANVVTPRHTKVSPEDKTTPQSKRTPKKLFERSPVNLSEFNVEVVENFVKITPSKSNKKVFKSDKDENELNRSLEVQSQNEKTPTKSPKLKSPSKVKLKLDFSATNFGEHSKDTASERSARISLTPDKTNFNLRVCEISNFELSKNGGKETNLEKSRTNGDTIVIETSKENNLNSCKSDAELSKRTSKENRIEEKATKENNLNSASCDLQFDNKSIKKINNAKKKEVIADIVVNEISKENNLNSANCDFELSDDSWDEIFAADQIDYNLDLSVSQHCKIVNVTDFNRGKRIIVKSTTNGKQAICNLEGFWVYTLLNIGDTIHISASKLNDTDWILDNKQGLLVYEPDFLVSTTSVVGAIFCKRRNILAERYKGFEPTNKPMIIGSLVHTLLQDVLKNKCYNQNEIKTIIAKLVEAQNTVRSVYEAGIALAEICEELLGFIPKIMEFVEQYLGHTGRNHPMSKSQQHWKGIITSIDDIEENIWCPDLGIKGKVDVSVETSAGLMPLELKTGRASVSLEHRGQVMLYIMMMNNLGYNVSSGLLLYLREGVLKEVATTDSEKRDIIMLRNELTYYLTREPKIVESTSGKYLAPPNLPEPINHASCAKCPYSSICTSYAKYNNEDLSNNKLLKNIQDQVLFHINQTHLDYFMKWSCLISLEVNQKIGSKCLKEIYTVPPKTRESKGRCIIDLKISKVDPEFNDTVEHTFVKCSNEKPGVNFMSSGISEGQYVVISTDSRPAVATGYVRDIHSDSISISSDKNLIKKYATSAFHIDTYDSTAFQTFNMSSLAILMELTPRSEQLRRIIVEKQTPTFQQKLPKLIAVKGKPILKRLNMVQQRTVLKAIAANDYFLIEGMPGTGKTATIVALIELLLELKNTILITSHTHSAVDNVCLRLIKYSNVKLIRLGNAAKIDDNLKPYSEHHLTKDCKTPEELDAVYNSAQVLAVTCLGSGHATLSKRTLDVCIVDESTQVLQSSIIRPICAAKKFILIGDPHQLPAVVINRDAIDMGMTESLFDRLSTDESKMALNLNYRMNEPITALANCLTYGGKLLIGAAHVGSATIKLPNKEVMCTKYKAHEWLINALDATLDKSVRFIDTGPVWNLSHVVTWRKHGSKNKHDRDDTQNGLNVYEAAIVCHIVRALLEGGMAAERIGVMATYKSQVLQIVELLPNVNVDISTVDQFQGRDKDVVVYSCTKSKDMNDKYSINKYELLEDHKRLTVAITRAKHKLIIVGDGQTLKYYTTFKKIMPLLNKNSITLNESCDEFDWENILKLE